MASWREDGARVFHLLRVARLRRALLWLALVGLAGAFLLYWRQQADDDGHRPALPTYINVEPQWTWICKVDRCERMMASDSSTLQSLESCNMFCGSPQLWPLPTGPVTLANTAVPVRLEDFHLDVVFSPSEDVSQHLHDAFILMKEDLAARQRAARDTAESFAAVTSPRAPVRLTVRTYVNGSGDPRMRLHTDESYHLALHREGHQLLADVTAHSFCGARHAFETLSQLVWHDIYADSLVILKSASIIDTPKFGFRGLLLDTARNFFPVADLLRTIDAMGACKLNTFHWHATDSQSFPLRLESVPELAAHGAYGPGATYSVEDVRAVVRRARLRGVRVLLEVDAPGHVGRAWSFGPEASLGHLALCLDAEPWAAFCGEPPCGQLNPRNPNVYRLLESIYSEIIQLTGVDDLFHLGGDEVSERCWQQHFNESDPMELWLDFTRQALAALERANGGEAPELTLLWSSRLTRSPYLERLDLQRLGVQIWGGSQWPESRAVLDAGFRAVLSHVDAWYLDCGFGSWRDSSEGHCGQYRSWQQMYEHRPWAEVSPQGSPLNNIPALEIKLSDMKPASWSVQGGAACQWSEQLGPGGLDVRVWPRAAAMAERLWSDPETPPPAAPDVYVRLDTWRARLAARGLRAATLWPRWCSHNPHGCMQL